MRSMNPHAPESSDMWCKGEYINIHHRVRICLTMVRSIEIILPVFFSWESSGLFFSGNTQNIRVHSLGADYKGYEYGWSAGGAEAER